MQQYVIFNVLKEYCIPKEEDDGEVRFVLDQHAELDFNSSGSLSADRHVAPFGHIILIPSQPVFALTP